MGTTAKTVNSAAISIRGSGGPLRTEQPKLLARAAGTLLECRRKERPPGVFHVHERGAGWSRTGPAHVPFPKSSIGGPAPIFWPNFLGKNFGNKNRVASSRRGRYASSR